MSLFIPVHQLGLYVIAATVATAPAFIGSAVSTSVLPTIASLDSCHEQVKAARRGVVLTLALTLVAAVVLAAAMHPIIRLVFGRAFLGSVPSARVLAFAAVMISLARTFQSLNKGIGRPMDAAVSEGAALVVTAAGLAALLGPLGIMGAAITSLCAYSTSVLIGAKLAAKALGVGPFAFLWHAQTSATRAT
jgi:O-antigen/teichoic acid export membrane protein